MREDLLQVPCPACGGVQEMAESAVPQTGVVSCIFCGERISFRQAPSLPVTGVVRVPGSPLPPPQPESGPSLGALDDWLPSGPVPESGSSGATVCCPKCGYAFAPDLASAQRPVVLHELG